MIPLLLCDIFDFIIALPTFSPDFENILGNILFACGLIGIILYVYIVRVAILAGIVHYVRKARKAFVTDPTQLAKAEYDPALAKNAFRFQVFFLLHVIGQMIVQVLMLVCVGRSIFVENHHFYEPHNTDTSINVSPLLWYMLVAVTVLPVYGFFTFFIVANYWVQQFPISFCIDLIKALKMPKAEEMFDLKSIAEDGASNVIAKIFKFVQPDELEIQYNKLQNERFSTKFVYPFQSPGMIFICIVYFVAQLAFAYIAALTGTGGNLEWFFGFYFTATALGFIFNVYSFLVSIAWLMIMTSLIASIIPIILVLILYFVCCLKNEDSN